MITVIVIMMITRTITTVITITTVMTIITMAPQANGNGDRLVQRAIRAAGHCEFDGAELVEAFNDLVTWERTGVKPAGDDVLTAATVASPTYGCRFTRKTRAGVEACPATP